MTDDNPDDPAYFHCKNFASCGNNYFGDDLLCKDCASGSDRVPEQLESQKYVSRQGAYIAHSKIVSRKVKRY